MPFRVTQPSVHRAALASLRQATHNLSRTQEELATARRLNRPSDAPLDAARAHRMRADRARLEQYQRNLEHAQHKIESSADVLRQISDRFVEARDVCVRAANPDIDATARELMASVVDGLLETLLRQANAQYDGHYLFAGTTDETAPFAAEPGGGDIDAVAYCGNEETTELQVGARTRVRVGEPGTDIFMTQGNEPGAFDAFIELRDLLRNTDGLSDQEQALALSAHIDRIDAAHRRVVDAAARFGWRSNQLEFTRTVIEDATLVDSRVISELEDADMAAAAARLLQHETAMQTALMISARMMKNSLLDYL